MTESSKTRSSDIRTPSEVRCKVLGENQFQLPERLVREVGFKREPTDLFKSAKVVWYYHEKHDKAVLANKSVSRDSLEVVGGSALSGVSNEDLESNDGSSARVTIISDLPDPLYEMLTKDDELVLRPLYARDFTQLAGTCISVYPGEEYDNGTLPNVDHEQVPTDDSDQNSNVVASHDFHQNSV